MYIFYSCVNVSIKVPVEKYPAPMQIQYPLQNRIMPNYLVVHTNIVILALLLILYSTYITNQSRVINFLQMTTLTAPLKQNNTFHKPKTRLFNETSDLTSLLFNRILGSNSLYWKEEHAESLSDRFSISQQTPGILLVKICGVGTLRLFLANQSICIYIVWHH